MTNGKKLASQGLDTAFQDALSGTGQNMNVVLLAARAEPDAGFTISKSLLSIAESLATDFDKDGVADTTLWSTVLSTLVAIPYIHPANHSRILHAIEAFGKAGASIESNQTSQFLLDEYLTGHPGTPRTFAAGSAYAGDGAITLAPQF